MEEQGSRERSARQYRIDMAYDGAAFHGWQLQPRQNSVQAELEKALAVVLRHPVRVTASSRTDTGVHAEQQVACFAHDGDVEERRFLKSLNALLPAAIRVFAVREADPRFHPIVDCVGKVYRYRLWRGEVENPFCAPLAWHQPRLADTARLRAELAAVVGTHDFTAFCAVDSSAKTRVRTIHAVHVRDIGPLTEVFIHGNGFLKQMVRSLVGSAVGVARGRTDKGDVAAMLAARDRTAAGLTAPAHGLCLARVLYADEAFAWDAFLASQSRGLVIPC